VSEAQHEREGLPRFAHLGVLALILVVHLPLLGFGLVYDDGWTLRGNGFLRPGVFDLALLASPEAMARHVPDAFRPTLVVFDMLSYRALELDPLAHHALSIALHLGVCALLLRLLARLGVARPLQLAALALFGVLAIHAEVVAVVSFREDLLAAALGLAALLAALRACTRERWAGTLAWAGAGAGLLALACGAKLSAAPLPALLVLLAWLQPTPACARLRERPARLVVVLLALALGLALALAQNYVVAGPDGPYAAAHNPRIYATRVGLAPVLAASAQIHVAYLAQLVVPLGLSPEYVDFAARWTDPRTLGSLLVLIAVTLAALRLRRRVPLLALAWLAWLLLALPTSNLIGMPNMRADRFMYLPSVPIALLLAAAALELGRRFAREASDPMHVIPLALLILVQGSFGVAAARVYVSNTTLWRAAVKRAPTSARAQAMLGLDRLVAGRRPDRAIEPEVAALVREQCEHARELDPLDELPILCLAELAVAEQDWQAAHDHFVAASELAFDRKDRPLASAAQLALELPGDTPDMGPTRARELLARGLSAYPYSADLTAAAARIEHRLGNPEQALLLYRRARALRPDRWETAAWGVELALDLGETAAAHRTWWAEQHLLAGADAGTRDTLRRRLADARRPHPQSPPSLGLHPQSPPSLGLHPQSPPFSALQSFLSPGVFPDDP
jgi:tetratricopeptide (TPR) repeat protein